MNKEAVFIVFKDLIFEIKTIPSICITILPDPYSSGYQIHVPIFGADFDRRPIKRVADKHQLAWFELDGQIIIYKPLGIEQKG